MDQSPNLRLPYIMAAQAQKHVTHNEAIRALDALVQIMVLDRDLGTPPASPADGARYLVAASPTGAWAGAAKSVAAYQDGAWTLYTPQSGWLVWVADEQILLAYNGTAWITTGGGTISTLSMLGINATPDTTNRLAVASAATLLNNAGAGHQLKINKATAGDTASVLYQTGFSGRAEMGLTGDDNYHFKVSADGTTWTEAIVINGSSGVVTFPNTPAGGGGGGSGGGSGSPGPGQGRLTLTAGVAVTTADVTGATTVQYAPHTGRYIPLWSGSGWVMTDFAAELVNTLSDTTKNPAAAAASKNYDLFVWSDAGTIRLSRGPAWTSDTARGTGVGTTELQQMQGVWCNAQAITNGPAAGYGTYVGSFGTNASSTADDTVELRHVWNLWNRADRKVKRSEPATSWVYTTAAWRPLNNSTANRISVLAGLAEDVLSVSWLFAASNTAAGTNQAVSVCLDGTTAENADVQVPLSSGVSNTSFAAGGMWTGPPGLGRHFLQIVEYGAGSGATGFYGTIANLIKTGMTGVWRS